MTRLVETVPGWTPEDQLFALSVLALSTSPLGGHVLEVGSWCGRSAAAIGHAVRRGGTGLVHAVDLFPARDDWVQNKDGTHSFTASTSSGAVKAYHDQTVWDEPFQRDIAPVYEKYDSVLEVFQETIDREGLTEIVQPFRGTLSMFAREAPPDLEFRLIFLDGDHGYDAVCKDIEVAEQFLMVGGWIAFDDAFTCYDGVDRAIKDRILASGRYDCAQQLNRKMFVARRTA